MVICVSPDMVGTVLGWGARAERNLVHRRARAERSSQPLEATVQELMNLLQPQR
jgi:hypothetical protein